MSDEPAPVPLAAVERLTIAVERLDQSIGKVLRRLGGTQVDPPNLISLHAAASLYHVGKATIRDLIAKGTLRATTRPARNGRVATVVDRDELNRALGLPKA